MSFRSDLDEGMMWAQAFRSVWEVHRAKILYEMIRRVPDTDSFIKQVKGKMREYLDKNIIYNEEHFDFTALEISLFRNVISDKTKLQSGEKYAIYRYVEELYKAVINEPVCGDIYAENAFELLCSGGQRQYFNFNGQSAAFQLRFCEFYCW